MPTYFRDGEGKATIDTVARWLVEQAAFQGWSLHDYVEGRCSLTDLGVAAENVIATLMPRIPDAHLRYNRDTPRGKRFDTWEAWFQHRLRNRIYYFFHRHAEGGGLRRCWRLCCTNPVRDSSRESSVVAGRPEQTCTPRLQDQELAGVSSH